MYAPARSPRVRPFTLLAASVLCMPLAAQSPVISEFMARNAATHRADDAELYDWIEIHNPSTATVDLVGYHLTDDPLVPTKWRFPSLSIAAGGHALVYASGLDRRFVGQPLHTNFELDGDGEYLALFAPDGVTVANEFTAVDQWSDRSFGLDGGTGAPGYFDAATPGLANPAIDGTAVAIKVKSSVRRGRYDQPFALELSTESAGASIRFTTDGSEPTRTEGLPYTGPITISRTTIVRAVAYAQGLATSKVQTWSYLFYADVASQSASPAGYPTTWGTHTTPDGTYTRVADYGIDPAIVGDPTYGPMLRGSLESLPVVSVVMDVDDLFDEQAGIYSNPLETGEAWERPASVELLWPGMGRQQQVDAGIRIFGRGSRRPWINSKFSFRLLFKDAYGATDLDTSLFGLDAARDHDTIVLRSVHGDSFIPSTNATYIRDMFVRETEADIGHVPAHGVFCHLFLNGMYWGLYNPSERPDASFQANYFGGKRGEWDVVKHFNATVLDGDRVAYDTAHAIAVAGLASPGAYASIQEWVDVENLADYMLLNFFVMAADWPQNNWYMARRRVPGEKFRFFTWDTEHAMWWLNNNLVDVRADHGPALFYDRLRANPEFRMLFADRVHALMFGSGELTTAQCVARFQKLMAEVRPAIVAESARWGDYVRWPATHTGTLADWESATAFELETFFVQRPPIVLAQLRAGGLYPNVEAPVFDQHGGRIEPGQVITLAAPGAGQILYTQDGSDPRLPGGTVAPTASVYTGGITLFDAATIKARVLDNGEWSALSAARFVLPDLVINEVLAENDGGIVDQDGEFEDWIELYNATARTIDAGGLFLTDDLQKPTKWAIPAGQLVAPGGYLLVWADEDGVQAGLHANFKLEKAGEGVFLFDRDGATLLSGFRFGAQESNVSTGWFDDGGATGMLVAFAEPTPGAGNEIATGRRLYNGRAQDLHPLRLGTGQVGPFTALTIDAALPDEPLFFFASAGAGYYELLAPTSEIAFLLDPARMGHGWLQADAQGQLALPLPLPSDPMFYGLRLYFQLFALRGAGVRASNAVELVVGP